MKIRIFLWLISLYILIAFGWLTFSLLNYNHIQYRLQTDLLEAGINSCQLEILSFSNASSSQAEDSSTYFLQNLEIFIDSITLNERIKDKFNNLYLLQYTTKNLKGDSIQVSVHKNPTIEMQNNNKRDEQKRIWIYQSLLLFLLVGSGIFGVYYSVRSMNRLNKQQNNFLLSVTHELRTPITAIRLLLQTVQRPNLKEDKKAELIEKAITNTYRLEELSENLLTAMQIENDKYQYADETIDFSDMVSRVVQNYSIKGEIDDHIEPNIFIIGDPFILRITISNLVENAFKYSDFQPIAIQLRKMKNQLELRICDQGIGISPKHYRNIFKKFYRVQDEETRTTKGTGLGLYIVKQAVKEHNGNVTILPNDPKGTCFVIKLPTVAKE